MLLILLSLSTIIVVGGIFSGLFDSVSGSGSQKSWKNEIERKYRNAYNRTNELIEVIDKNYDQHEMKKKMVSKQMSLLGIYQLLNNYKSHFNEEEIEYILDSHIDQEEYEKLIEAYDDHIERLEQFEIYYFRGLHR